jgi:hypothetical protein
MDKKQYEALIAVRDLLRQGRVRCRNVGTDIRGGYCLGGYCLTGAVNHVTHVSQEYTSLNMRNKNRPFSSADWETRSALIRLMQDEIRPDYLTLERFNDSNDDRAVLTFLDYLIRKHDPKAMEIGEPEKVHQIEPATPVPGVKEQPATQPLPTPEPVTPEREKVPA